MTHEEVNRYYAEIQALLRDRLQARGRGIVEMSRDVEALLPRKLAWQIREVGRTRNRVVHEALPAKEIPKEFKSHASEIIEALRQYSQQPERPVIDWANGTAGVSVPPPRHGGYAERGPTRLRGGRSGYAKRARSASWRGKLTGVAIGSLLALGLCSIGYPDPKLMAGAAVAGAVVGYFWMQSLIVFAAACTIYWLRHSVAG